MQTKPHVDINGLFRTARASRMKDLIIVNITRKYFLRMNIRHMQMSSAFFVLILNIIVSEKTICMRHITPCPKNRDVRSPVPIAPTCGFVASLLVHFLI